MITAYDPDGDCNDINECTTDTCTAGNACQYSNVASGTARRDGLWCTLDGSTCDGSGNCTGGTPRCPPGYLCDKAAPGAAVQGGQATKPDKSCLNAPARLCYIAVF